MKALYIPDLSKDGYIDSVINIQNKNYIITFRWNNYADCCYMNLKQENKYIIDDTALHNDCIVKVKELPAIQFKCPNNYEPLKETIKECWLQWEE